MKLELNEKSFVLNLWFRGDTNIPFLVQLVEILDWRWRWERALNCGFVNYWWWCKGMFCAKALLGDAAFVLRIATYCCWMNWHISLSLARGMRRFARSFLSREISAPAHARWVDEWSVAGEAIPSCLQLLCTNLTTRDNSRCKRDSFRGSLEGCFCPWCGLCFEP